MIRATCSSRHADPSACLVPSVIQCGSDASQRGSALAQPSDLIQHCLLGRFWLHVLPVGAEAVSAQIGWLSHRIARSACFAYSLHLYFIMKAICFLVFTGM